ncbi:hypothetical protein [Rhodococcus sp. NPDC060176]|uniref:hypothetical protein n=1 Tax=Rhodococcus sp. NPDC060176 TaxID=3347062 RepID=UPI003646FB3A
MSETNPDTELSTINYPIELIVKIGPKRWNKRRTTIFTGSGDLTFPITTTPRDGTGEIDVQVDVVAPVTEFLLQAAAEWEEQASVELTA